MSISQNIRPAAARTSAPLQPQVPSIQTNKTTPAKSEKDSNDSTEQDSTIETTTEPQVAQKEAINKTNLDSIFNNQSAKNDFTPLVLASFFSGLSNLFQIPTNPQTNFEPNTRRTDLIDQQSIKTPVVDTRPLSKEDFILASTIKTPQQENSTQRENLRSNFETITQSSLGERFNSALQRTLKLGGFDPGTTFESLQKVPDDTLAKAMSNALLKSGLPLGTEHITDQDLLTNPDALKTKLEKLFTPKLASQFDDINFGYDDVS